VSDVIRAATIAAPWGPLELAASHAGLVALDVLAPPAAFDARVEARRGRPVSRGSAGGLVERRLEQTVAAVEAFLAGRPEALSAVPLDLGPTGPWDLAVFEGVRAVPYGHATSYGRLARAIGRRGAARAVGGAVGRCSIGLAIPCHRVIAGDGSIGGYGGEWWGSRDELLAVKRTLLELEGITLPVHFEDD
jgi:O-6-methylguanine DNA methyltransferase